jgi:L-iditol 2-dehydrogenase
MRVARSVGVREVVVEDGVAEPVAGAGEVVCRVLACGVCGSDISAWVEARLPAVLGHELTGEVVEVGGGVIGLSVGDRVVIHHHVPCGECRRCARGHETLCESYRASNVVPGGFAERVLVPAELVGELLLLEDLDEELGTFVEPLGCVLRALGRGGVRAGDSLLVVGAGTSGLLAIAAAHARGVEAVWVREPREDRMAAALALGAERHGNELVDVAFVASGAAEAVDVAFEAVAPGGALVLYATPTPGRPLVFDAVSLYRREVDVLPSYAAGARDMIDAYNLLRTGAVDPMPWVTHRVGLEETGRALEMARTGEAIKVLVLP